MNGGGGGGNEGGFGSISGENSGSDVAGLGLMDGGAMAKQMAALNAAGRARMQAQGGRGVAVMGASGGSSSVALGGLSSQPTLAQQLIDPFGTMNRPQQPPLALQQQQQQARLQRLRQFLNGLASVHIQRGAPLPPPLTGVPSNYDPTASPWNVLQLTGEPGFIRLAAKDIDLFKLFQAVMSAGGGRKVTEDKRWPDVLAHFDLPPDQAQILASISINLLSPLEDMYRRKVAMQQQQQQQQQLQQGVSHTPQLGVPDSPAQPMMGPTPPVMQNPQQIMRSSSSASVGLPSSTPGLLPTDPMSAVAQPSIIASFDSPDHDAESKKRKLIADEEAKRSRQKTAEPSPATSNTPLAERSSVPPTNGNVSGPSQSHARALSSSAPPGPSTPSGPQRRRVEYRPLVRELDTDGGRDSVALIEEQRRYARRGLRDIDEWGALDIDALTMSLRSRISVEVSYALTTLTMVSIMRAGITGFPINNCEDLLDELLDLIVETGFGDDGDNDEYEEEIITYKQLSAAILDDGHKLLGTENMHQQRKSPELGPTYRPADVVLTAINILRNLSVVPGNMEFLARHERVLPICVRLCGLRRTGQNGLKPTCPIFSLSDLATVRRDVLYLLVNLGSMIPLSSNLTQAPSPSATRMARRVFDLSASYLLEPAVLSPCVVMVDSGGRVPALVDAALEVFCRYAQPDTNRKVIAKTVFRPWQRALFTNLIHRLPLGDADFQMMREETWLSYVEKVVMALFTLAFLAPPELKREYRTDRTLGVPRLYLRLVKKFTVGAPQNMKPYWGVCARRAVETLKVLDDDADAFQASQSTGGPVLAFGMGFGDSETDKVERGSGLLSGFREDVLWNVMLQKDVGNDESLFNELESLTRVDMAVGA